MGRYITAAVDRWLPVNCPRVGQGSSVSSVHPGPHAFTISAETGGTQISLQQHTAGLRHDSARQGGGLPGRPIRDVSRDTRAVAGLGPTPRQYRRVYRGHAHRVALSAATRGPTPRQPRGVSRGNVHRVGMSTATRGLQNRVSHTIIQIGIERNEECHRCHPNSFTVPPY